MSERSLPLTKKNIAATSVANVIHCPYSAMKEVCMYVCVGSEGAIKGLYVFLANQVLGYLYGIKGGPLAYLITHAPERKSVGIA